MQIVDKLNKIDTSKVGGKVKYYRLLNKMSVAELSELTGVSRDNILQYEECANFCPPAFCAAVAKIWGIELELLSDDFIVFINSDYVAKINSEKERTGLSYSKIAEKYGIAPAALLGWVKGKYAPSRASFRKYIKGNPLFYDSL